MTNKPNISNLFSWKNFILEIYSHNTKVNLPGRNRRMASLIKGRNKNWNIESG